jgi:transcription initiation factor TFIID TATA-box-binding protein
MDSGLSILLAYRVVMVKIRIENVVASTALADELDLQTVALGLKGAEYARERFPGIVYRLAEPKTAILLFHSGKMICTGAKSMRDVESSIATVAQQVGNIGQRIHVHPRIVVQNIVASSDLGSSLNLSVRAR